MKEKIRYFIAGIFIGLSELLPGISGATVAPDIPGNNSDNPINIPAIKYLIFSFIHHYHLLIYLQA